MFYRLIFHVLINNVVSLKTNWNKGFSNIIERCTFLNKNLLVGFHIKRNVVIRHVNGVKEVRGVGAKVF